jgi:hypothetical protein
LAELPGDFYKKELTPHTGMVGERMGVAVIRASNPYAF